MQRRCLMHCARSSIVRLVLVLGAALAAVSCSKDDIPTTPPSPYLFTDIAISKFVSPPLTDTLVHGKLYVTRFNVDYTLDDTTNAKRALYGVYAQVNSHAANGSFLAVIGTLAFTPQTLTGPAGTVADSIAFTVPASGASYISVEAGLGLRTDGTFNFWRIGPFWSVK
jgi:hypothetical protein